MLLCLCLSVALHSSALAAVILMKEQTDIGAVSNQSEAISVEIVASAVLEAMQRPKTEDQPAANEVTSRDAGEAAPQQAAEDPAKTAPEVAAAQTETKEAAPQQADTPEHDKPKTVSEEPAPVLVAPPPETTPDGSDEMEQAESEAAKAREATKVARRDAEKREEKREAERKKAEREHAERRKREEDEKREARRKDEEHKKRQKQPAQEGGATAKSASAGSGLPSRASASAGSILTYAARVRAQVASHKPSGAGAQGTAVVSFAVTASGGLGYASLARSSGNAALDRLALAAVRGAAPFPAPPSGASPSQLRFSIPFHFQ